MQMIVAVIRFQAVMGLANCTGFYFLYLMFLRAVGLSHALAYILRRVLFYFSIEKGWIKLFTEYDL